MRVGPLILSLILPALPACAPAPPVQEGAPHSAAASRGHEFAQAHCSRCHAVAGGRFSPDPNAPPFEAVVNAPGLDAQTLGSWLRNAHDFPRVMNFEVEPARIDDLTAYMLTLRSNDYTPPTQ
jgi:mono/diheme cytochrome c family protein